jgi:beta-carotene 3-hydroxylase
MVAASECPQEGDPLIDLVVIEFLCWVGAGFFLIEVGSGMLHKYLFHGVLWFLHESHHRPRRDRLLEENDVFAVIFALIPLWLMTGSPSVLDSPRFAIGAGITLHGFFYFILHDLMTHRRWWPLNPRGRWIAAIVQAHRVHHQKASREGQGPWGLFFVSWWKHAPSVERKAGRI